MRIVTSVEDFRACRDLSARLGKWQAWLDGYYSKYRHVFDWMLRFLYLAELDSLRGAVESLDFDRALARADAFLVGGGSERVRDLLEMSERVLKPGFEYDALLMIGLGHAEGTVIPGSGPAVYLGLEILGQAERLPMVVPHELNHLVRLQGLLDHGGDLRALDSFGERVIAEGLATVTPLVASNTPLTPDSLTAALMMPRDAFDDCDQHWPDLWKRASSEWSSLMTQQLMTEYFGGTDDGWINGHPARSAYYIGTRIITNLLEQGHRLPDLTLLPTDRITSLLSE